MTDSPATSVLGRALSLRVRPPQVGTVLTLPGAVTAELISEPFDVVWIDLDHGSLGRAEVQEMILGAQAAGASAYVRVSLAQAETMIGPMLDAGADGIVLAGVRASKQAVRAGQLLQYRPRGERGYGPRRSALRSRIKGVRPSGPPRLWVQIESQQGVAEAEAIASTGIVDALVVGVAELCIDLNVPMDFTDDRLHDAIRAVREAARPRGVLFGLAGPLHPSEDLDEFMNNANIRVHSTDARLCAAAVDDAAEGLRCEHTARRPGKGESL